MRTSQEVGLAVREARLGLGWTQAQLAERSGVGRDWLVRLEQGHPRLELAKVLDTFTALGLTVTIEATPPPNAESDPFASILEGL